MKILKFILISIILAITITNLIKAQQNESDKKNTNSYQCNTDIIHNLKIEEIDFSVEQVVYNFEDFSLFDEIYLERKVKEEDVKGLNIDTNCAPDTWVVVPNDHSPIICSILEPCIDYEFRIKIVCEEGIFYSEIVKYYHGCQRPNAYLNVKTEFGATGNGVNDDAPNLRKALSAGVNLYFPAGEYKLCSLDKNEDEKSLNHFLTLSSVNNGTTLYWHENAVFFVCEDFLEEINPLSILQIKNEPGNGLPDGNVENITLIAPNVDGRNVIHTTWENPRIGGIMLFEDEGYNITGVNIIRPNAKNCTGSGITSWGAKQADIYEAVTKNNKKQGIGVRNIHNKKPISLNIYGHTSIEDNMSVAWSGNEIIDGVCDNENTGMSKAFNLRSENSKYGIKTAGTWDLFIHDMEITGSENNGFWNNCNAPKAETILEKVRINNCLGNGISLKESSVIIRDAVIENNGCDFKSVGTNLHIDDISIISNNDNGCGMRMSGESIHVENFSILANNKNSGQYALWLYGNVVMNNGIISSDNQGVIFRPLTDNSSAKLCLDSVTINAVNHGITSMGENHTFLKDCMINAEGLDIRLTDENSQPNQEEQTVIVNNTEINPDVGQIEDPKHYCTLLSDRIMTNESNKSALQNYPNPFNNSTTIKYKLPEKTDKAMLVIYDLSGKTIKSYDISDGNTVDFEVGSIGSGTYLYTIIVNGKTLASKKMIKQ